METSQHGCFIPHCRENRSSFTRPGPLPAEFIQESGATTTFPEVPPVACCPTSMYIEDQASRAPVTADALRDKAKQLVSPTDVSGRLQGVGNV